MLAVTFRKLLYPSKLSFLLSKMGLLVVLWWVLIRGQATVPWRPLISVRRVDSSVHAPSPGAVDTPEFTPLGTVLKQ